MNAEHRRRTRELVRKYAKSGTESLIAFVAETNGMLDVCKTLLQSVAAEGVSVGEWLQRECADAGVRSEDFLHEVKQIVALFMPSLIVDDHYSVLGLAAGATPDEVKRAYRALSLQYHPDTASPADRNKPEKFIAINEAYRALLHDDTLSVKEEQKQEWRRTRARKSSPEQKRQLFIWLLGLVIMLVVVSSIASLNLKKRAMLAGLQETRGAFIPPVAKKSPGEQREMEPTQEMRQSPPESAIAGQISRKTAAQTGESNPRETHVEPLPAQSLPKAQTPGAPHSLTPSASTVSDPKNVSELPQDRSAGVPADENKLENEDIRSVSPAEKKTGTIADTPVKKQENRVVKAEKPGGKGGDSENDRKPHKNAIPAEASNKALRVAATEQREKKGPPSEVVARPATESSPPPALPASSGKAEELVEEVTYQTVAPAVQPPLTEAQRKIEKNTMLQAKVDQFLKGYINAYEQRNLLIFSRCFLDTAEENGKPVNLVLPVYMDLFASTNHLSFQIVDRTVSGVDGGIAVEGKFKVGIDYSDGGKVAGSGPIHFLLSEGDNGLLIKDMQYEFHAE